jgi:hypothetical protein
MTERAGGSDVGRTATQARCDPDGRWRLHGAKWFASAATAECALALARPQGAPAGSRGLGLFLVELVDADTGRPQLGSTILVDRLKDKLGTRALPTAELTLRGAAATPVGGPDGGLAKIAGMLNVTRLHNAVNAAAGMRHGLDLAAAYARTRQAFGRPLVELPLHRLTNPWTLGAVLHEISHNLHSDLAMDQRIPGEIARRLSEERMPASVVRTWARWNRESFADLSGLLLGGPAIVTSLMDIIGRSPETVLTYNPTGPHPTPYIRAFISIELLRRLGFDDHVAQYRRLWTRLYPDPRRGTIPGPVLETFPEAVRLVVDAVCFRPFAPLGDKRYADVIQFGTKEQVMIEEAAGRLATGTDPGIVPERFLIGASRVALSRELAPPEEITQAFYRELARR